MAGGFGTRLREETEYRPKPMVEIGDYPILWHIMKNLSVQGINEFILCLGYKGEQIRDYFLNYEARTGDVTVNLGKNSQILRHSDIPPENWSVLLANTGLRTMTGGRIHRIQKYLGSERFFCTYGDGLANINLSELLDFHTKHGKIASVTAVRPTNRFGSLTIDNNETVTNFSEKPRAEKWVNGGFFIFESKIFDFLNSDSVLEREPLERLSALGELKAYKHSGFWQPMDTYRESQELNDLWSSNSAPWRNWP